MHLNYYQVKQKRINNDLVHYITGDKQSKTAFDRFDTQNYLGAKKWMLKWNN